MTRIEIVNYSTGEVEETIEVSAGRNAEKVERGININLSMDYYTRLVTDEED